jgi:hypothetical protein
MSLYEIALEQARDIKNEVKVDALQHTRSSIASTPPWSHPNWFVKPENANSKYVSKETFLEFADSKYASWRDPNSAYKPHEHVTCSSDFEANLKSWIEAVDVANLATFLMTAPRGFAADFNGDQGCVRFSKWQRFFVALYSIAQSNTRRPLQSLTCTLNVNLAVTSDLRFLSHASSRFRQTLSTT